MTEAGLRLREREARMKERFQRKSSHTSVRYLRRMKELGGAPEELTPFLETLDQIYTGMESADIPADVPAVGTYCVMAPQELIYAAGARQVKLCSGSYTAFSVGDKVEGLDSGADDYLTKPFVTKELLARIRALLRRYAGASDNDRLEFGDLSLNLESCMLSCSTSGQSVRLREKEFKIMQYLLANQGQIFEREKLAVKIWDFDSNAEYNNVEVYISFTRKKLAFIESKVEIKSVRGIGYELRYNKD